MKACSAIGIDCPPGQPRPTEVFLRVLRGTELRAFDFDLQFKMYGAWLWHLKPDRKKEQLFLTNRALFIRRLQKMVETAVVRGAVIEPEGGRTRMTPQAITAHKVGAEDASVVRDSRSVPSYTSNRYEYLLTVMQAAVDREASLQVDRNAEWGDQMEED